MPTTLAMTERLKELLNNCVGNLSNNWLYSPHRAEPSSRQRWQTRWCHLPSFPCPRHSSLCQTWMLTMSWKGLCSISIGSCSHYLDTNTYKEVISFFAICPKSCNCALAHKFACLQTSYCSTVYFLNISGSSFLRVNAYHRQRSPRWKPGQQSSFRWCDLWRSEGSVFCWHSKASADCLLSCR